MNSKCKPGDLAIVVSCECRCNLGRIVRVLGTHDGMGILAFPSSAGQIWLTQAAQLQTWYLGNKRIRRKFGPIPDRCLQPIRGNWAPGKQAQKTAVTKKPARSIDSLQQKELELFESMAKVRQPMAPDSPLPAPESASSPSTANLPWDHADSLRAAAKARFPSLTESELDELGM